LVDLTDQLATVVYAFCSSTAVLETISKELPFQTTTTNCHATSVSNTKTTITKNESTDHTFNTKTVITETTTEFAPKTSSLVTQSLMIEIDIAKKT
jgi:hypothetical protein